MVEDAMLKRLDDALDSFESERRKTYAAKSSVGDIIVKLGGGSIGVWVCATLCSLCFMTCLFLLWVVADIRQNDRDQGNQLNAIYMMAPHLKPEKKP